MNLQLFAQHVLNNELRADFRNLLATTCGYSKTKYPEIAAECVEIYGFASITTAIAVELANVLEVDLADFRGRNVIEQAKKMLTSLTKQTRAAPRENKMHDLFVQMQALNAATETRLNARIDDLETQLKIITEQYNDSFAQLSDSIQRANIASDSLSVASSDLSVASSDLSVASSDLSVASSDLSVASNDLSVASNDLSVASNDLSVASEGLTIASAVCYVAGQVSIGLTTQLGKRVGIDVTKTTPIDPPSVKRIEPTTITVDSVAI